MAYAFRVNELAVHEDQSDSWRLAAPNVQNVEVVPAFAAYFAILPLKWQADVREEGAESSFCVGGSLAYYR